MHHVIGDVFVIGNSFLRLRLGEAFGSAQSIKSTIRVGNASAVPLTGSPFTGSNNRVNIAIDLSDPACNISGGAILN